MIPVSGHYDVVAHAECVYNRWQYSVEFRVPPACIPVVYQMDTGTECYEFLVACSEAGLSVYKRALTFMEEVKDAEQKYGKLTCWNFF